MLFFEVLFHFLQFHLSASQVPNPSDYPTKIGGRCGFFQFDCDPLARTPLCIPLTAVRDCVPDCPNMSDEWCGQGKVLCDVGIGPKNKKCGKCVLAHEMNIQCLDRKWQHLCAYQGTFKCARTMNCVFGKWLMDGKDDCGDGSDEDVCRQGILKCAESGTTTMKNEVPTTTKRPTKTVERVEITQRCEMGEFRCLNGQCIDSDKVLNGNEDCQDESDENYCEMGTNTCPETSRCSYQTDVQAFGCGCPRNFQRNPSGICVPKQD